LGGDIKVKNATFWYVFRWPERLAGHPPFLKIVGSAGSDSDRLLVAAITSKEYLN
jgi:hypothetical protein